MEIEFNIPEFRAELESTENRNVFDTEKFLRKKIFDKYYIIGALNKKCQIEVLADDGAIYAFNIDKSTLSINFPDMIDSENNPIFASLSKDGKGGDIGQCFDYGENKYIFVYNSTTFDFGIKLIIEENTDKECWDYESLKAECFEIFNIIGIQE